MIQIGERGTFDPIQHIYRLDGVIVPSFSRVIEIEGLRYTGGDNDTARLNGLAIHKAVELFVKGTLDWKFVDQRLVKYLEGLQGFLDETGFAPNPDQCERPLISLTYRYGCTPDLVGSIHSKPMVCDIKSGSPAPWHKIQTAAQALVLWPQNYMTKKRMALYLYDDGSYKVEHHTDMNDFNAWVGLLSAAMTKINMGIVKLEKEEQNNE